MSESMIWTRYVKKGFEFTHDLGSGIENVVVRKLRDMLEASGIEPKALVEGEG